MLIKPERGGQAEPPPPFGGATIPPLPPVGGGGAGGLGRGATETSPGPSGVSERSQAARPRRAQFPAQLSLLALASAPSEHIICARMAAKRSAHCLTTHQKPLLLFVSSTFYVPPQLLQRRCVALVSIGDVKKQKLKRRHLFYTCKQDDGFPALGQTKRIIEKPRITSCALLFFFF